MGSKNIKAIIVDDKEAQGVTYHDEKGFKKATSVFRAIIRENNMTKPSEGTLARLGTAWIVDPINDLGGWPTRNFSQGQFEGAKKLNGRALRSTLEERGGNVAFSACSKCIIQCSNVYLDSQKNYLTSNLEYETIWSLGANCGIDDLDAVARMDRLCDDYGLDTIEMGCALAVAMEAGLKPFGEARGAIDLLLEVGAGTPLGRILGNGAALSGKVLGCERVPVVKRQGCAGYDPRVFKGLGVTYATSPMGADHTAGFAAFLNEDDLEPEGKPELSRNYQLFTAFIDATGLCLFVTFATTESSRGGEAIQQMINALYGWNMSMDDATEYGKGILRAEQAFNKAVGFTSAEDRLPEFFALEPLAPHNTVFDVGQQEVDRTLEF